MSQTASPAQREIGHASRAFGKVYSVTVNDDQLDASPAWAEDEEHPPLSARHAMKLATELKDRLVNDSDDYKWKLETASLNAASEHKWYWLIQFGVDYRSAIFAGTPPDLRLVVLMDGTVIEPRVHDGN